MTGKSYFRRGDVVGIRTVSEILATLDSNGTLDGLPFMPEMREFCGRRYRVFRRAEQVCLDGVPVPEGESRVRAFVNNDVVFLENLRCSGAFHDSCKRGCLLFWKEAWLRKVNPHDEPPVPTETKLFHGGGLTRTKSDVDAYFCQSSEILKATRHLSLEQRVRICFVTVRNGNQSLGKLLVQTWVWFYWRWHRRLMGVFPRGTLKHTPTEILDLQPGEWVEVKSLAEIIATLDEHGKNRGLHFTTDMRLACGRRYRVKSRVDQLIAEGSGKLRKLRHTVILDGAMHVNSYYVFGGCSRCEFQYWREIWLRRVAEPDGSEPTAP